MIYRHKANNKGDNNETHAKDSVGNNARDALDNDFDSAPNEQEP